MTRPTPERSRPACGGVRAVARTPGNGVRDPLLRVVVVSVLGAATRLGYDDGHAGTAARTGNAIAYALGLASWTGLQQLQLRQAYVTGRQHGVSERRIGAAGR